MSYKRLEPWPESDKNGTPIKKLPDCPNCENDELSMIYHDRVLCNACGQWYHKGE